MVRPARARAQLIAGRQIVLPTWSSFRALRLLHVLLVRALVLLGRRLFEVRANAVEKESDEEWGTHYFIIFGTLLGHYSEYA